METELTGKIAVNPLALPLLSYLARTPSIPHVAAMLNLLSILVAVIAFPVMLLALIPLLGWLNYVVLPLALVGAALGAMSSSKSGRNLNIVVLVIGSIRLWLGGFIL